IDQLKSLSPEKIDIVKYKAHQVVKDIEKDHRPLQGIKYTCKENTEQEDHRHIQQHIVPLHLKKFCIPDILNLKKEIYRVQKNRQKHLYIHKARLSLFLRHPGETRHRQEPSAKTQDHQDGKNRQIDPLFFLRRHDDPFFLKKKKAQGESPVQDLSCAGSPGPPPALKFVV